MSDVDASEESPTHPRSCDRHRHMRLGFLVSHRGSNMRAIVDACRSGRLDATPCIVISNNGGAEALDLARDNGLDGRHISARTHGSPEARDRAILDALEECDVSLLVLAGYMKKLGPSILRRYSGGVLNIHPALLPRYGGRGMYGWRVHGSVLAAGENYTGVTVHLVDEEYDHGPIVALQKVAVHPDDTPECPERRVLQHEHQIFPQTLQRIYDGSIRLEALDTTPVPGREQALSTDRNSAAPCRHATRS